MFGLRYKTNNFQFHNLIYQFNQCSYVNVQIVKPAYIGHSQKYHKLVFKTNYRLMQVKGTCIADTVRNPEDRFSRDESHMGWYKTCVRVDPLVHTGRYIFCHHTGHVRIQRGNRGSGPTPTL